MRRLWNADLLAERALAPYADEDVPMKLWNLYCENAPWIAGLLLLLCVALAWTLWRR